MPNVTPAWVEVHDSSVAVMALLQQLVYASCKDKLQTSDCHWLIQTPWVTVIGSRKSWWKLVAKWHTCVYMSQPFQNNKQTNKQTNKHTWQPSAMSQKPNSHDAQSYTLVTKVSSQHTESSAAATNHHCSSSSCSIRGSVQCNVTHPPVSKHSRQHPLALTSSGLDHIWTQDGTTTAIADRYCHAATHHPATANHHRWVIN